MRVGITTYLLLALLLMVVAPGYAAQRMNDMQARELMDAAENRPLDVADRLSRGWRAEDALRVLTTHADTTDPAVLWRLARARVNIAERLDDPEAAEPWYEAALDNARLALEKDPDNADAHLMVAIAAGRVAIMRGPFSAAGLVKDVHRHALRAVANSDSLPIALYVLGRTHDALMEKSGFARRLAGLSFASEDSVGWYFDRALEVSHGNMIQCRVEYAGYLIEQGRTAYARDQLTAALALSPRDEHDPDAQERAREMLDELNQQ